mmetsp:Transcript_2136/g.5336  ORF Transcript_2136/g.5336 Transcript_2136/m.5336 type:complete len:200 (-) Transcript_2136:1652-2251(-)
MSDHAAWCYFSPINPSIHPLINPLNREEAKGRTNHHSNSCCHHHDECHLRRTAERSHSCRARWRHGGGGRSLSRRRCGRSGWLLGRKRREFGEVADQSLDHVDDSVLCQDIRRAHGNSVERVPAVVGCIERDGGPAQRRQFQSATTACGSGDQLIGRVHSIHDMIFQHGLGKCLVAAQGLKEQRIAQLNRRQRCIGDGE